MAEYIFKYLVSNEGLSDYFDVTSSGVSAEESGNDIYPPAKRALKHHGIPFSAHRAHRITNDEFASSDIVIALDSSNLYALKRRFGDDEKIRMLLSRSVEDPWYTDDFEAAFNDIWSGCKSLLVDTKALLPDIM